MVRESDSDFSRWLVSGDVVRAAQLVASTFLEWQAQCVYLCFKRTAHLFM